MGEKPRERRLQGNESKLLMKHLSGETKKIFELATETGMRRGEMLSLEWRNVDLKKFTITQSQLRDAWETARTAAGIQDIRLHDLRHEAVSRLFEKGLNVMEAASVTGHKTLAMLKRYTHLNPTDIAKKLG